MIEYLNMNLTQGGFIVLIIVMIWTMVWTAIALWKCARNNQIAWFVVLLILNTMGLLEIIYLAFFQRNKNIAMPVIVESLKPEKKRVGAKKHRTKAKKKR